MMTKSIVMGVIIFLLSALSLVKATTCGQPDYGDAELREFLRCTCAEAACNRKYNVILSECAFCVTYCFEVWAYVSLKDQRSTRALMAAWRCNIRYKFLVPAGPRLLRKYFP